ncbi:GNAT family N-acetyltransferase [Candidatus Berkelbacteria bacterium]|nr:GNAT family N-acetyltransferase [Candidatus Berkelbacteria bacterium]
MRAERSQLRHLVSLADGQLLAPDDLARTLTYLRQSAAEYPRLGQQQPETTIIFGYLLDRLPSLPTDQQAEIETALGWDKTEVFTPDIIRRLRPQQQDRPGRVATSIKSKHLQTKLVSDNSGVTVWQISPHLAAVLPDRGGDPQFFRLDEPKGRWQKQTTAASTPQIDFFLRKFEYLHRAGTLEDLSQTEQRFRSLLASSPTPAIAEALHTHVAVPLLEKKQLLETIPDLEEARTSLFNWYRTQGIVTDVPHPSDVNRTVMCVDFDRLASPATNVGYRGKEKQTSLYESPFLGNKNIIHTLALAFGDQFVFSRGDWEKQQDGGAAAELKQAFFAPKTNADLLDPEKLKTFPDFHRGFWEMSQTPNKWEQLHPGLSLPVATVALMANVFHPSRGAGQRGSDGRLWMRHPDDRADAAMRPMTNERLRQWYGAVGSQKDKRLDFNPSLLFQRYLEPYLGQDGPLKASDFPKIGEASAIKKTGETVFQKVIYNFGRKLARLSDEDVAQGAQLKVSALNDQLGQIMKVFPDGTTEPLSLFPLHDPAQPATRTLQLHKKVAPYPYVSIGADQLNPADPRQFFPRHSDEPASAYDERVQALDRVIADFPFEQQLAKSLRRLDPPITWQRLDRETQLMAIHGIRYLEQVKGISQEEIDDFIRRHREDGLQAFRAMENGLQSASAIMDIDRAFAKDPYTARRIFAKYGELVQATTDIQAIAKENRIQPAQFDERRLIESLQRRGVALLQKYARPQDADGDAIVRELENFQAELLVFGELLKNLPANELADFKKADFSVHAGPDLLGTRLTGKLMDLTQANWRDRPAEIGPMLEELRAGLHNPESRFYLAEYNDQPVGYLFFEPQPDGSVYANGLNVTNQLRSSGIGSRMLREAINQEAAGAVVTAIAHLDLAFATRYVGDYGFVVDHLDPDTGKSDQWQLGLRRDDQANTFYQSLQTPTEELVELQQQSPPSGITIRTYDLAHDREGFITGARKELEEQGMVITAYRVLPGEANKRLVVYEPKARISEGE